MGDLFFVIAVLAACVIMMMISMYKDAVRTENQDMKTQSDPVREIERLQDKYQEVADKYEKLLEEIRRLRFENSYLTKQACSSDITSDSEFRQNLKDLIFLAHPDKHGGHDRAKRITQWLLEIRRKTD